MIDTSILFYLGIILAILGCPLFVIDQLPCFRNMGDPWKFHTLWTGGILIVGGFMLILISVCFQRS
jgi:prolipoprotein diacylglyceryltransferase